MSLYNTLNSLLGAENLDADDVTVTAEEAAEAVVDREIAELETQVEAAKSEAEEAAVMIDVLEEKVEDLEEAVDGMERMLNGQESYNPALFAERYNAAAKIVSRLTGATGERQGAESFADETTANINSRAGIEGFKETMSKAGNGIKDFFVRMYNAICNWIAGLFNTFIAQKTKATKLKEKLNGEKGKIKEKYNEGGWAAYLDASGNNGKVGADLAAIQAKAVEALSATDPKDMLTRVKGAAEALSSFGSKKKQTSSSETNTNYTVQFGKAGILAMSVPKQAEGKFDKAMSSTSAKVKTGDFTPAKDQSPLAKDALNAILDSVISACDTLRYAKADRKSLTGYRDQAIAKFTASGARDEDKEAKKSTSYNISCVKGAHKGALAVLVGATDVGAKIVSARNSLVAAHL